MVGRGALIGLFGERHPLVALALIALLVPALFHAAGIGLPAAAHAGAEGPGIICTAHDGTADIAADHGGGPVLPERPACCGPFCAHAAPPVLDAGRLGFDLAGLRSRPALPPRATAPDAGPAFDHEPIRGPPRAIA